MSNDINAVTPHLSPRRVFFLYSLWSGVVQKDELVRSNLAADGYITGDEPPRITARGHEHLCRALAVQLADLFTRKYGAPYDRERAEALRDTLLALATGAGRAMLRDAPPDPEAGGVLL